MKYLISFALLWMSFSGFGQDKNLYDVVILNDGSKIVGKILDTESLEELRIENDSYGILHIKNSDVKRVYPNASSGNTVYEENEYTFAFESAVLANQSKISPSIQFVLHRIISENFSLGIGTGVNVYDFEAEQINFPLFLSARTYLADSRVKPFLELNAGYSFTTTDDDSGMIDSSGGLMINPRFGIRVGSDDFKVALFTGFKYQKSTYIYQGWGGEYEQKMEHNRLEFGMGLHF